MTATCPSLSRMHSCAWVLNTELHHAVAGIGYSPPRSDATDGHVCGLASKQWIPIGNHIPAMPWCHCIARVLPALRWKCRTMILLTLIFQTSRPLAPSLFIAFYDLQGIRWQCSCSSHEKIRCRR